MSDFYTNDDTDSSSDEEITLGEIATGIGTRRDPNRDRRKWFETNYDILQELYHSFRDSGETVFGGAFFQLGDFARFVNFVYSCTVPFSADLLKANTKAHNVIDVGARSRSKHWIPCLQATGNSVEAGSCGERVGRCIKLNG